MENKFWKKIQAKQESGLTTVRLKWDPPVIPFKERYRARRLLRKHPLLFYIMLKQGKTWFSLVPEPRNLSVANDNN